jgi:hypothetical protein
MIARFETSVLNEIVYLDPELNGDAEYFRARFRPLTPWSMVRPLIFSPCFGSLMAFVVLLIIGVKR